MPYSRFPPLGEHNLANIMNKFLALLTTAIFWPSVCAAGPLYLYTYQFDPTPHSLATTISYLSDGLIASAGNLYPGQTTVISAPGVGATQYPGLGSGNISQSGFAQAFNTIGGTLGWIFQETSAVISGTGVYPFLGGQLSAGFNVDPVTGNVTVQQLAVAPQTFRYLSTFNATPGSAATQFYYDSPVFLPGFNAIDPSLVQLVSPPAPGAQPDTQTQLYGAGNSAEEGYFKTANGTGYFFVGNFTKPFDIPGTYNFTSANIQIITGTRTTTYSNATGSLQLLVLTTPEPSVFAMASAGLCAIALLRGKRR